MIHELFDSFDASLRALVRRELKADGFDFKPKWVVATTNERLMIEIDSNAINAWITENEIVGHCCRCIGAVMLADDAGMTMYRLRWADEYL
jgi:hypothetical protein